MSDLSIKLRNKVKAAAIHLLISLLIFSGILYLILFQWYPEPFFTAQGGWQGIRLMALVDLVLGPTLTLIVFNHMKKRREIMLDLSVIALVQLTALIWGGYTVYTQRPVALVYWAGNFYTVTSDDYAMQGISNPDFSNYSSHVPPLIYAKIAVNKLEVEKSRQLSAQHIPAYAQVNLYEKIEDNLSDIFLNQVDISNIMINNPEMKQQLQAIVKDDFDIYKYLGLKAKYQNMILVMDKSGKIVGEVKTPYLP